MKRLTTLINILIIAITGCSPDLKVDEQKQISYNEPSSAVSSSVLIDNGSIWKDAAGNEIKAQGGCIIKSGSVYHWFGPQFGSTGDYKFYALNHYTSSDLKNWEKLAPALTPGMPGIPFSPGHWVGRPWVNWNPNDNRYVMALEWGAGAQGQGIRVQYGFLTAPSLNGPWTYQNSKLIKKLPDINNNLYPLGDLGFYSEGGNAWLLYTFDKPEPNYSQAILKLGPDFMTPLPHINGNYIEFSGGKWKEGVQEAAAVVKKGDTYYYFTSLCNSWKSSESRYRTAPSMSGPWTANKIVPTNPASSNSFNTQHDFILPIIGTASTTYIYCGDRWSNYTSDSDTLGRNAWYPLTFDVNGVPTINAPDYGKNGGDWMINVVDGTWSIPVTNKIQNAGFENDLASWSYTGNISVATDILEVYQGIKAVKSWSKSPYSATLTNASATNCIAGTYSAKVWSRADGSFNQRVFQVYVNNSLVEEIPLPLATKWTQYEIKDIDVPSGATVKLGISLNSNGGGWTQFDEFEVVRN